MAHGGNSSADLQASVVREPTGWKASFGALLVGTFASDELAWRSLDLLRLKSGMDAGLDTSLIQLRFPLRDYLDEQTAQELRSYTLPQIVAAVRSFAVGGRRAPACGPIDQQGRLPRGPPGGGAGKGGGSLLGKRPGTGGGGGGGNGGAGRAAAPSGGGTAAGRTGGGGGGGGASAGGARDEEGGSYRGVTRDSNGRQQSWVALVYASLDAQKCPTLPTAVPKISIYIAACRTAREAAVLHDVAVVWWSLGLAYRHLWQAEERATAAEADQSAEGSAERQEGEEVRRQDVQQQQQGGSQQGGEDSGGARQGGSQPLSAERRQGGASPALPDPIDWQPDAAVLRQLNFSPELVTGRQALMRQLLLARSMPELRNVVARLRSSGQFEQMVAASQAVHAPAQAPGAGGLPTPLPLRAPGGGARATDPRRRARKPGQALNSPTAGGGSGAGGIDHRGTASSSQPQAGLGTVLFGRLVEPATVGDAVPGRGQFEVGKHGRLHDKPFMGLVRDRQITLHPWRPMICALVEGHSKPQPRSLTSCATAEEAAVARDLGWVWLWKRTGSLRQQATLNFSLSSYGTLGGTVLDDLEKLESLNQLRAHLRSMRDSGRLLSLAASLMRAAGRPMPAAAAPTKAAGKGGQAAGGAHRGSSAAQGSEAASEDELGEEEAAEEMLHLLRGDHSGHSGAAERSAARRPAEGRDEEGEEDGQRSQVSGSRSGYASATSEDAGALDDSGDEDFQLGRKAGRQPPRKRARASPPPAGEPQPRQQQQQQQQDAQHAEQQPLAAAEGAEDEAASAASGSKYVGVQRIASSKHASKQWIPRPTVRVLRDGRLVSKQLTLCYCDTADEAAVARDVATIWSQQEQQRSGPSTAAAGTVPLPRLNFPLDSYRAQPGLLDRLQSIERTEAVQALAKELRDSGTLLRLAGVFSGSAGLDDGDKGAAAGPPAATPSPRSDSRPASPRLDVATNQGNEPPAPPTALPAAAGAPGSAAPLRSASAVAAVPRGVATLSVPTAGCSLQAALEAAASASLGVAAAEH